MTRRAKSKSADSTAGAHDDAFPSSPRRPPVWGLYITNDDKSGVLNYVSFSKDYSAAAFIQDCIELHGKPDADKSIFPHLHEGNHDLVFEDGWRLSTRGLGDLNPLVKYKFSPREAEFTIPDNIKERYQILGGRKDKPIERIPGNDNGTVGQSETSNSKPSTRPAKPRGTKPSGDLVTLASFVTDAGKARATLRKANFATPQGGWAWPKGHPDIEKVKKLLKV